VGVDIHDPRVGVRCGDCVVDRYEVALTGYGKRLEKKACIFMQAFLFDDRFIRYSTSLA
jgi:hypothetical protein